MNKYYFLALLCGILMLSYSCTPSVSHSSANDTKELDFPTLLFQNGDLVFRCGLGFSSNAILMCEDDPMYSHVGVLVKQGKNCFVVHAAPNEHNGNGKYDKVMREPLSDFWHSKRCSKGGAYRVGISADTLKKITDEALILASEKRPFDHKLSLSDTNAIYCTELIYILFKKHDIDITQGKRLHSSALPFYEDLILPGHILLFQKLKTIYTFSLD